MKRNGNEHLENDTSEECEPDGQRLLEKSWFGWAGILLVLCGIGVLIIWFMPSKIDKVVEGFELGDRAARFETVR